MRPVADVAAHLRTSPHSLQRAPAGVGYVDQAHLTNEFRTITGMTWCVHGRVAPGGLSHADRLTVRDMLNGTGIA